MTKLESIILGIGLIGFFTGFVTQFMLKHYVPIDRVRRIENPIELYKNCIPPKKVLTNKDSSIHKIFTLGL